MSEGSYVRRGEIIARLENADYQAQAAQARGRAGRRREPSWSRRGPTATRLAREARRLRDIRAQNPELVAEQESIRPQSRAAQAAARAQAAEARIAGGRAGLRFAQANLENTVIRAPFTGTVLRKDAEVGEVVAPSVGGGLTRGAVVTMADLTTLEVEVDVNEAYIARVRERPAGADHARRLSRHRRSAARCGRWCRPPTGSGRRCR